MDYLFRFERTRPFQKDMMDDITAALSSKRDILVNAPTGVGKTDAALSAALTYALNNDLDVFFLTPKISQHRIAVDVLSGIRSKFGLDFSFVDMVGKRTMCVNDKINAIENEAFYAACENLVKKERCPFFSRAKLTTNANELKDVVDASHNTLFGFSFDHGLCAYEIAAKLARDARVVVAGYPHILNPYTRSTFLKKIAHSVERSVIIWDEAHNILEAANSYFSNAISNYTIERASAELKSIGSPIDLSYLSFALKGMSERHLRTKAEAFIGIDDMPEEITAGSEQLTASLERAGLEFIEQSRAKRSSLMHLAKFLEEWKAESDSIARIMIRRNDRLRLTLSCLYPDRSVPVFGEAYSNIFMSATLVPLDMHANLLGVGDAMLKSYGSPFPQANRRVFIDASVTTKYEHRSQLEYKKIALNIMSIKARVPGNLAVFFPSFDVLDSVHRHMADVSIFRQRRDMKNVAVEQLITNFRESQDSMLFAVMGGSLSEGIDYPNNSIKGIVIVGIPLTKPDLELSAKISYINKKFTGRGSEYMYTIPAVIRAVQAAGRAIRSETDRAVIVLMDMRYGWRMYSSLVRNSIPIEDTRNYISRIDEFWKKAIESSRTTPLQDD
ncbi:MAG: ATP-dependent DNA helicase [Candidatus Marsarchaeota archaeon]|jgi:DNA excision repair protein ERCC-2|nr:ATP-dependent DNA helicase [Candidatus Marsarchaeota archaeon]